MKHLGILSLLVLCFVAGLGTAQSQVLTEYPLNQSVASSHSGSHSFVEYNGKVYFIASPDGDDRHIYEYDPAGGGSTSTLLATSDLSDGGGELVLFNSKLYIGTYSSLIEYDGTDTTLIASFPNDNSNCAVRNFTVFGSELVFTAKDAVAGPTVHSYDGTSASLIYDAAPTANYCWDQQAGMGFTVHNGSVWWTATVDNMGQELVEYDGTNSTAYDTRLGGNTGAYHPTSTPFGLVYVGWTDANGREPSMFDGSNFSTIADLRPGGSHSMESNDRNPFGTTSNAVYWSAEPSGAIGYELWSWDGTDTSFVANIDGGSSDSRPHNFTAYADTVYFVANTDSGHQVFRYDGATLSQVIAANAPGAWSSIYDLAILNGMLYAFGEEADDQPALWAHDLSTGTTVQIASNFNDRTPESESFSIGANALYCEWAGPSGWEPAMISGTTVTMLGDINQQTGGAEIEAMLGFGDTLYLLADDGEHGTEPMMIDLNNLGAAPTVIDLHPGPDYSEGEWLYEYNGNVLLETTWSPLEDQYGDEIFYFTGDTCDIFVDVVPGSDESDPEGFATLNGVLYFRAEDPNYSTELFKYDGTNATMVADIYVGGTYDGSDPDWLTPGDGKLYFAADDNIHGEEVWVHDPANNTTQLLAETAPNDDGSSPEYLTWHNGQLYWTGYNSNNKQLWTWNGTDTVGLSADWSSDPSPQYIVALDGFLYMRAELDGFGRELVCYDPVQDTVGVVADVMPGTGSSNPEYLTVYNGQIFFAAQGPSNGKELWKYDPATNTTSLAADISPGSEGSWPEQLTVHQNTLWFSAEGNATDGEELWSYFECPAVQNMRERQKQDVSVHLEWDIIEEAALYKIWWKEASSNTWNVEIKNANQGKRILTGLTASTNYRWKIQARANGVWGPVSDIRTFKTLAVPCQTPSNLLTDPVATDKARFNWGVIPNISYYKIRWREAGGSWNVINKGSIWNKHWLTGLTPGTTYEWQQKAVCPGDPVGTPWSQLITFTTATNKWNVDATDASSGTAAIDLTLAPNPNNGQFTLSLQPIASATTIEIYDPLGRLVYKRAVPAVTQTSDAIDLSNHSRGLYMVRVTGESVSYTTKMMVQ